MKYYNIYLDAGHGLHTLNKHTPDGISEWELNDKVCKYIKGFLMRYNCHIFRCDDQSGEVDVIPLSSRLKAADIGNADACISIHHNIIGDGSYEDGNDVTGVEVFISNEYTESSKNLASKILDAMLSVTKMKNRGLKTGSLSMCSNRSYPTVLCEGGFMNNKSDHDYIVSEQGLKDYARAVSAALISYFKMEKDTSQDSLSNENANTIYIVGDSYTNLENSIGEFSTLSVAISECDKHTGFNVYDDNGKIVHESTLKSIAPVKEAKVILKQGLQMRSDANNVSETIAVIDYMEKVIIMNKFKDPYWLCRTKDGRFKGYMYNKFLKEL